MAVYEFRKQNGASADRPVSQKVTAEPATSYAHPARGLFFSDLLYDRVGGDQCPYRFGFAGVSRYVQWSLATLVTGVDVRAGGYERPYHFGFASPNRQVQWGPVFIGTRIDVRAGGYELPYCFGIASPSCHVQAQTVGFPSSAASCSGVSSSSSRELTSAPAEISARTASVSPPKKAAWCSGVQPSLSRELASAPAKMSAHTASESPPKKAAWCSGVSPSLSRELTSAPSEMSTRTASVLSSETGYSDVPQYSVRELASAPAEISARTASGSPRQAALFSRLLKNEFCGMRAA